MFTMHLVQYIPHTKCSMLDEIREIQSYALMAFIYS